MSATDSLSKPMSSTPNLSTVNYNLPPEAHEWVTLKHSTYQIATTSTKQISRILSK